MDDVEIFVPISMGTIAILIFTPILMGLGFVYQVREWFINNLYSIIVISIIVALIVSLISSIYLKNILVAIASLFCSSQAIFFLVYYGMKLPEHSSGLAVIGHMIIFIIYVVVAGLDIIASCILPLFVAIDTGRYSKKNGADIAKIGCTILGSVGWAINIGLLLFIS